MVSRPILRHLDLRLSFGAQDAWKIRQFGNGVAAEYQVSELLDRSRYLYGMHEYVPSSVFVAHIRQGSLVLDVGANLGEYTVLAARATGEHGHVIAFEPNPDARARLIRNVDVNGFSNVEVSSDAIGSEDGEAILRVPNNASGLGSLRAGVSGTEHNVQLRRLDRLMGGRNISRLGVVKVDVEGLELQVLEGGQETIENARPVIIYECAAEAFEKRHGRMVTPAMWFLEDLGYDNFVIKMSRIGDWALHQLSGADDPRIYREPWEVLVVIGIPREKVRDALLGGKSALRPCGVFELFGR